VPPPLELLSQPPFTLPPPQTVQNVQAIQDSKCVATAQSTEQPSCQFPNEWITAGRRFVLSLGYKPMLRVCYAPKGFNDSPQNPQHIVKPQNVEGSGLLKNLNRARDT